jgi:hypothetical protein
VAFETDDDRRKPISDPPASLGDLAAGLTGSSAGEEADDAIDSAALAALSQAASGRKAVPDDAAGARVRLADVPADLAAVQPLAPSAPPARSEGRRLGPMLAALAVGFGLGVPVGAYVFSSRATSELSAARQPPRVAIAPQPSAAVRHADDMAAAARFPLPGPNARVAPAPEVPPPAAAPEEPANQAAPQPAAAGPHALGPGEAQKLHASPRATAAPKSLAASSGNAPQPAPSAEAAPAPPKPAVPEGPDNRSVDDLLDQALAQSGGPRVLPERAERALAPEASLPLAPTRDDVTRAMTVLLPAIRGCAGGESGLATVGIVVRNDGHVESVSVTGAPFEGARSGRCMEGVVRKAKFPRFQQSSFRVQFPFAIQ